MDIGKAISKVSYEVNGIKFRGVFHLIPRPNNGDKIKQQ